jgi:hypothetical protein
MVFTGLGPGDGAVINVPRIAEQQSSRSWALPSPPRTTAAAGSRIAMLCGDLAQIDSARQDRWTVGTGIASLEGFRRRRRSSEVIRGERC